jgi:hypothetical protein
MGLRRLRIRIRDRASMTSIILGKGRDRLIFRTSWRRLPVFLVPPSHRGIARPPYPSREPIPAITTGSRSGNSATRDSFPPKASMERRSVEMCKSVRRSISETLFWGMPRFFAHRRRAIRDFGRSVCQRLLGISMQGFATGPGRRNGCRVGLDPPVHTYWPPLGAQEFVHALDDSMERRLVSQKGGRPAKARSDARRADPRFGA